MGVFGQFNFDVLKDRDFREDSVREELVAPLLRELGYAASGPDKIIRSKRLVHPFVYIGTLKKGIQIIPDYLLLRNGQNSWILDAKSPTEVIESGKNVEQAYSYAIHKDIGVPLYALCNGSELIVFHISKWPHELRIPLKHIEKHWDEVNSLLGARVTPEWVSQGFRMDFGLSLWKAGLARDKQGRPRRLIFASVHIMVVAKTDDKYTLTCMEDDDIIMTFDFDANRYDQLLAALPENYSGAIKKALLQEPFHLFFEKYEPIFVAVAAELPENVVTNEKESFCPFIVDRFF